MKSLLLPSRAGCYEGNGVVVCARMTPARHEGAALVMSLSRNRLQMRRESTGGQMSLPNISRFHGELTRAQVALAEFTSSMMAGATWSGLSAWG